MPRRAFPAETVRDLLGIARLLYRAWSQPGMPNDSRVAELVAVGKDLQEALRVARDARPGSRQLRAAWERAEMATARLGGLLDAYQGVKPLVSLGLDAVNPDAGVSKAALARRR